MFSDYDTDTRNRIRNYVKKLLIKILKMNIHELSTAQLLVAYARLNPEIWQQMIGLRVTHTTFEKGNIRDVKVVDNVLRPVEGL